jgi:hypothetical protein
MDYFIAKKIKEETLKALTRKYEKNSKKRVLGY